MQEIWKPVKDFESLYEVSNMGKVRSRHKKKNCNDEFYYLKPTRSPQGYDLITLYTKDHKRSKYSVHYLVASHFIPNPKNLPCVNHKDEDKANNCVDNLEWCSYAYNNAYGTARIRKHKTVRQLINQFTLEGEWIATYESPVTASLLNNVSSRMINTSCRTGRSAGGYFWSHVNPNNKLEFESLSPNCHNNFHQ